MGKGRDRGLKRALAAIDTYGGQMHREAMGDYKVTLSALSAGQRNLSNQLGRYQRDLAGANAGANRSLGRLTAAAKANQRQVQTRQNAAVRAYGSGLGSAISRQFAGARAQGTAGVMQQQGAGQAFGAGLAAGATAVGITREGASMQKQAAKYAMAQALQQRNIVDNSTLAQLTGDIYKSQLQELQAEKLAKYQYDLTQKAANKKELAGINQAVPAVAADVRDSLSFLDAHKDEITSDNVATQALAWAKGAIVDPAEQQAAAATAANVWKGVLANNGGTIPADWTMDSSQIQSIVHSSLMQQYPQYAGAWDTVDGYLSASYLGQGVGGSTGGGTSWTLPDDFGKGLGALGLGGNTTVGASLKTDVGLGAKLASDLTGGDQGFIGDYYRRWLPHL
jgi:hypothetical protein